MQRSVTQTLFSFLPGALFVHEEDFVAQVSYVHGTAVFELDRDTFMEELGSALSQWRPDQQRGFPPSGAYDEYKVVQPGLVSFEVYPLVFECTRPTCRRVKRWYRQDKLVADNPGQVRCGACKARMRQLRYVTAHQCGHIEPVFTPKCRNCNSEDHVWLEDNHSFRSSSWRCRACGAAIQQMRQSPCSCGRYQNASGKVEQRGFTIRDKRLWTPHLLTVLNLSNPAYRALVVRDDRSTAAIASWLGDETNLAAAVKALDSSGSSGRMTASDWAAQEQKLRDAGIDDETIADIRAKKAPPTTGVHVTGSSVSTAVLDHTGPRIYVERAGIFDAQAITRDDLTDLHRASVGTADQPAYDLALLEARRLGILEIGSTQKFPIVMASYGYSRAERDPGAADLLAYPAEKASGKVPIYAVPAETEALLVSVSATDVVGFLATLGLWTSPLPVDERSARIALLEEFARDPDTGTDSAAGTARRLMHSMSHALLRALDDGESGFGESTLAEWIVPDMLTTAIYVSDYSPFTLGAFDTVLRRRSASWLRHAAEAVATCDNDPLCHEQLPHAACDRCLHLSFGCRSWNADLDRRLLGRFWRWTQAHHPAP